jgi:predicted MFS family arabinose efflux permease
MLYIKPYFEVLKNWDFTKLWLSQVCSQLTNYLLSFAVLLRTFKLTESSLAVAFIVLSFGLATVIFGSLAGVYADRFDRRKLLTTINILQALTILAFIPFKDSIVGMAMITFVYSSLNQFYLPSEAPSIPDLVRKDQILVANSYFSFTTSGSMLAGFVLAGPLMFAYGPVAIFISGFFLLLLAATATYLLPPLKSKLENPSSDLLFNVWGDFKEGISHFWHSKVLHFPLQSLIMAQVFNGMLITIAPAFVQNVLDVNLETGVFYMIAPLGLGILIGALLLGIENNYLSKPNLILAGFLGMGIVMVIMSLLVRSDTPWTYAILALLLGYFNAHIFAPSHSIIQHYVVERVRGRIYGSLYLLLQASATLPAVFIGLLADRTSALLVFASVGIVLTATGILLRSGYRSFYRTVG